MGYIQRSSTLKTDKFTLLILLIFVNLVVAAMIQDVQQPSQAIFYAVLIVGDVMALIRIFK